MAANLEKLAEQLSELSVLEAADLVKLLEEKWGVSAAAPVAMAAAGPAAAAEPVEEKTEFDVVIKGDWPQEDRGHQGHSSVDQPGFGRCQDHGRDCWRQGSDAGWQGRCRRCQEETGRGWRGYRTHVRLAVKMKKDDPFGSSFFVTCL